MKVYLAAEDSRYDLSSLLSYGVIIHLAKHLNPFDVVNCQEVFMNGLDDFDPTEDYICMTGNLQLVAFLLMIAYEKFDTFKILVFDAKTSNYKERIISHV